MVLRTRVRLGPCLGKSTNPTSSSAAASTPGPESLRRLRVLSLASDLKSCRWVGVENEAIRIHPETLEARSIATRGTLAV